MLKRWYQALSHSTSLLPPYVILILSLSITGLLTSFAFYQAHLETSQRFDRLSRQTINAIHVRMNDYIDALLHTRGLFLASNEVTNDEFQRFIQTLDLGSRYPGIQGVGFARRVEQARLNSFVGEMRRSGLREFHVWPSYPRAEFFPVAFLEPVDWRNRRAIGFDMFTEPNRQEAMKHARDTGQPVATSQVVLKQETEKDTQPGFLIYVPVYDKPASTLHTVEQRRSALIGFIFSPFRAVNLFRELSRELNINEHHLDLEVFDGNVTDRSRLLFHSGFSNDEAFATPKGAHHGLKTRAQLEIAGQTWTIVMRTLPKFSSTPSSAYPWFILIIGLVASVVGYRWSLTNARYNLAMLRSSLQLREIAERKTFVTEAIQTLSSTLSCNVSLRKLAELLTRDHADLCAITMRDPGPKPYRFCASASGRSFPSSLDLDHPEGVDSVARNGETQFIGDTRSPSPDAMNIRPEWLRELRKASVRSYICVPLNLWDQNFGSLMLALTTDARRYTKSDLDLAQELAERAATAIENSKVYDEAKRVNRIKDEFLATLSHELRTPLNVIQGHAELLMAEAPPNSELVESAEAIYRNARTQTQIVDDLLDVSSIITGKITFHPQIVNLANVVDDSVEAVGFSAKSKQIKIINETEDSPLEVNGDPIRLQQIIWNLLSNAIKFTPNQGRISISARREGDDAVIRVKDTGQGVDRAFLPDIFDRFRQEDGSMTRQFGGLGLGLSIVRSLVELHGGTVTAWSEGRGKGTEFKVSLPLVA